MTAINDALENISDLQSLIDVAEEETPTEVKTGVQRTAEIAQALSVKDIKELASLQSTLESLLDQILANHIDPDSPVLTDEQLFSYAREHMDRKELERLLKVRHEVMRAAIFAHITEVNRAKGLPDPEHQPGEAPIPGLGKTFAREGGKMKATINKTALEAKLGKERWEQVCKAVIVPAVPEHIEYHLDDDALLALVKKDPSVMEAIRESVIPGGYGVARLVLKETKK